jgi:hypothetical protein
MNIDTINRGSENITIDFAKQIVDQGILLTSTEYGNERISLYRTGVNHYLVFFRDNVIVRIEKTSRNLAHMQFPGLIVH